MIVCVARLSLHFEPNYMTLKRPSMFLAENTIGII